MRTTTKDDKKGEILSKDKNWENKKFRKKKIKQQQKKGNKNNCIKIKMKILKGKE